MTFLFLPLELDGYISWFQALSSVSQVVSLPRITFHSRSLQESLCARILSPLCDSIMLISLSNSGMWGCVPMIFLRSTVALMWTAISVVQVSYRLPYIWAMEQSVTFRPEVSLRI